jgi:hypothetical protein
LFVLLYIDALLEPLGHPVEVNPETPCQVNEYLAIASQLCLISGRLLRGALLHIQVGRINDAFLSCPCGQFPSGGLPAGNLLEGHRKVCPCVLCPLQGQLPNVVILVLTYKCPRGFIDKHDAKIQKNLNS